MSTLLTPHHSVISSPDCTGILMVQYNERNERILENVILEIGNPSICLSRSCLLDSAQSMLANVNIPIEHREQLASMINDDDNFISVHIMNINTFRATHGKNRIEEISKAIFEKYLAQLQSQND